MSCFAATPIIPRFFSQIIKNKILKILARNKQRILEEIHTLAATVSGHNPNQNQKIFFTTIKTK